MPWPTPQDYNEAIQNPKQCFADPELTSGSPELNPLGLPRPITGNFASVYRVHCGRRDWAVRCFWREFADLQTRYSAISSHLGTSRLPYTVGFEYLTKGINVRGTWYPVLKMEWVEGELLDSFIRNHLGESTKLRELATAWQEMCAALERAGVAHGDLQHGNVLVSNGRLVLVDYDGMYVPALSGLGSHETGHPHYQHPKRSGVHFGTYLDRFSEWSISTSLLAVAAQPDLWAKLNAGDECLLLRRTDYDDPSSSAAFQALEGHSDAETRAAANQLTSFLKLDPSKVRPLIGSSAPADPGGKAPSGRFRLAVASLGSSIVPSVPPEVQTYKPPRRAAGTDWLADHVELDRRVLESPSPEPVLTLLVVAVALLICASVVSVLIFSAPVILAGLADASAGALGLLTLVISYRRTGVVVEAADAIARTRELQREEAASRREIVVLEAERVRLMQDVGRRLTDLRQEREALQREAEERQEALQDVYESRSQSLSKRLSEFGKDQDAAVKRAVQSEQGLHIHARLRRSTLFSAPALDLDWATRIRLLTLGVWSAADVTAEKIRIIQGLGERQLLPLVTWRVETEKLARRTAPKQLPEESRARLVSRQTRILKPIEAANRTAKEDLANGEEALSSWLSRRDSELAANEQRLQEELDEGIRGIESEVDRLRTRLTHLNRELGKEYGALRPYRNVRFGLYLRSLARPRRPIARGTARGEEVIPPGP